MALNVRES